MQLVGQLNNLTANTCVYTAAERDAAATAQAQKRKTELVGYLRAWAPMNGEPRKESAGLMWIEGVDFEHGCRVRACVEK